MASRWEQLKGWMFSKPTAEELQPRPLPPGATGYVDQGRFGYVDADAALAESDGPLDVAAGPVVTRRTPVQKISYQAAPPPQPASKPKGKPGPPRYDMEKALAGKPVLGPETEPKPIRPEVRAYLEKRATEKQSQVPADERDAELESAQAAAEDRRLMTAAGRVGAQISAASADQDPRTYQGAWDERARGDDQPVKDLQARRDAARVKKGEQQADEDRARTLALDDAGSEASQRARDIFTAQYPEQAARFGDRLANFSASALTKLAPSIEKELERTADTERQRKQIEAQAKEGAANRALQREIRSADNATEIEKAKLGAAKGAATADKDQKKALTEIQDRHKNIKDQLGQLREMVRTRGTNEFLGGHNKILEQKLTSVATDMAKLVDPNSVARESEVQTFKKMLFEPGLWQRDSSAQEVLSSFEQMVDDRLGNAYTIRGLEQPKTPAATASSSFRPVTLKDGRKGLYNAATGEFRPQG